ncbi:SSI family serine proteinase inhibitor [Streptomyces sp. NPDC088789]|uniref:SSI family serine proteinase inhibitor n=1 Tax=Streptomyces sp. NPDC088789 TaxID=3365899 RepID=UPI003828C6D5
MTYASPRITSGSGTAVVSLRRVGVAVGAALAVFGSLAAVPADAAAQSGLPSPALPPPIRYEDRVATGQLTVTVRDGKGGSTSYDLSCRPHHGDHPDVSGACGAVERETVEGRDPFAPVPEGSTCTMLHGGEATAHVTGTWSGRRVDARYDRSDGCEIARWNRLVPLLPSADSGSTSTSTSTSTSPSTSTSTSGGGAR